MAITPLPPAPEPTDSTAQFNSKAFAWVGAIDQFTTEANALGAAADADATTAVNAKNDAELARDGAVAASNVTKWVSGTTYAQGAVVWSPISFVNFRRKIAGGGTTDPSLDSTNWEQVTGTGNVSLTGTQTLTNKTINGENNTIINVPLATGVAGTLPVTNGGTGATTLTGVVKGNGASAFTAGSVILSSEVSGTLPVANGGTGLTSAGTAGNALVSNGTSWVSELLNVPVNYPQNIQSANYTLVLSDAGKQIYHPASDATIRTFTIPSNASVPFSIGTTILFVAENGGTYIKVAINSDTLVTTDGVTGTKTVYSGNILTCIKVTSTKWICYLANDIATSFIALAHTTTPFITVYARTGSGFGIKYANPATLLTDIGRGVAFSPNGSAIAVALDTTPFITAYPWSGSGFGTKYSNPATLPAGAGTNVAFSPNGSAIAVAHLSSPNITAYPWSGSGFGTKYANPATLPAGDGVGVAFSPDGSAIAVAHDTSPRITAYPWSGSGFGTKYANPATLPTGTGRGVAFSPDGSAIAVAHETSPFITAYPWSGSGFGTKYADPATLPTGNGRGVAFSPDGSAIAVAHLSSPNITAYPWSGSGFGTKYANPATLPTGNGFGVAFSPDGSAIAVAHSSSPFITAYPWSGSGFGIKYADPATLPTGTGNGVAFSST